MEQYLDALRQVVETGVDRSGRNGDTRAVFGMQMRFDMSDGFPAVTTKQLAFNTGVKAELLGFLRGYSDVKDFQKLGCNVWNQNAEADYWKTRARFEGDLGRIYGVQWRSWKTVDGRTVDQLAEVIEQIRNDPSSRRHVVTAWNPGELDQNGARPMPCVLPVFRSRWQTFASHVRNGVATCSWVPRLISHRMPCSCTWRRSDSAAGDGTNAPRS